MPRTVQDAIDLEGLSSQSSTQRNDPTLSARGEHATPQSTANDGLLSPPRAVPPLSFSLPRSTQRQHVMLEELSSPTSIPSALITPSMARSEPRYLHPSSQNDVLSADTQNDTSMRVLDERPRSIMIQNSNLDRYSVPNHTGTKSGRSKAWTDGGNLAAMSVSALFAGLGFMMGTKSSDQSHDDQNRSFSQARAQRQNDDWEKEFSYCKGCNDQLAFLNRDDCLRYCPAGSQHAPPSMSLGYRRSNENSTTSTFLVTFYGPAAATIATTLALSYDGMELVRRISTYYCLLDPPSAGAESRGQRDGPGKQHWVSHKGNAAQSGSNCCHDRCDNKRDEAKRSSHIFAHSDYRSRLRV